MTPAFRKLRLGGWGMECMLEASLGFTVKKEIKKRRRWRRGREREKKGRKKEEKEEERKA